MTTITASTSVVLVDTTTGLSPYIVYFPYNTTVGRIITVRDNSGYASTNNSILISTQSGVYFQDNQSTLTINQPYGYITFSVQPNSIYSILNTFAFPTESASAYVYNVNTSKLGIEDSATNVLNYLMASTGNLYYNSNVIGNVTQSELTNSIINLESFVNSKINSSLVVRRYVSIGNTNNVNNPVGTIQYSDNSITWNNSFGGFSNGGIDVAVNPYGLWVACGNNYDVFNQNNNGFLQWSTDGIIWKNSSNSLSVNELRSRVYYANGLYHAVGLGSGQNTILWSSDGKNWNPSISSRNIDGASFFNSITYGRNIWVACGNNSAHSAYSFIYSTDGSNWLVNTSIDSRLGPFYDIIYTDRTFVALTSNATDSGNILVSVSGRNDSTIIPLNLSNETGFLATDGTIVLSVTPSYHKFSIDYGYTWNDITGFPSGIPGRPFYDGSLWWVGINSTTSSNMYYSSSGSNVWSSSNLSTVFPSGNPISLVSLNSSSNLGLQLISTVEGLQVSFQTSTLTTDLLNIGSFNIYNDSNILNISSINSEFIVYTNNLSTNYITTNILNTNYIQANDFNTSTINVSTLFSSDYIFGSSIITSSIITDNAHVNILSFDTLLVSTLQIDEISTMNINTSTINVLSVINANEIISPFGYIDTVSSTSLVVSTINFIDGSNGVLTNLNAYNNNLYFQNQQILTSVGTNPIFFTYQLIGVNSESPDPTFFTVNADNLINTSVINLSITDINNIGLSGFYSKVGIYSLIHVINTNTNRSTIYRIDTITTNTAEDVYTFGVSRLVGSSTPLIIGNDYSIYITSIGLKPPPSSPTDAIIVNAQRVSSGLNFGAAFTSVPINIGVYRGATNGFSITLNPDNYNQTNIPATVGSITYFDSSANKYKTYNVKYGSINDNTGSFVSIDSGVNTLSVSGLTVGNFPGVGNDNSPSGYAIYIVIKFLN